MIRDAAADAEDRPADAALLLEAERGLRAVVRPADHQLAAELVALALVEREAEQVDGSVIALSGGGAVCCAKAGEAVRRDRNATSRGRAPQRCYSGHLPTDSTRTLGGARMRFAIHVDQLRGVDVRVALRGAQPRVAEQLLDRAQVGAALQQMGRERVAQRVRADAHARAALRDVAPQQAIDAAAGQPRPAIVDEERIRGLDGSEVLGLRLTSGLRRGGRARHESRRDLSSTP